MKKNLSISEKIQNESTQGLLTERERFISEVRTVLDGVELMSKKTSVSVTTLQSGKSLEEILADVMRDNMDSSRLNIHFVKNALRSFFGVSSKNRRLFIQYCGAEYRKTKKMSILFDSLGVEHTISLDNFFSVSVLYRAFDSVKDRAKMSTITKDIFTPENIKKVCVLHNFSEEEVKKMSREKFKWILNLSKK